MGILRANRLSQIIFGFIVLTSGLLWLHGSNWGQPYSFHSDEFRHVTHLVKDPSAPFWTIYGRWPIYLLLATARLAGQSPSNVILARRISTLASLAGLIAAALTTRRLCGWAGALVTASLLASAPLIVQTAHFFITDVFLFTGAAASMLLCLRVVQYGKWRDSLGLGLTLGIATGSKLSGLFLLPAIGLAHLLSKPTRKWQRLTATYAFAAIVALLGQPTLLVHGFQAFFHEGQLLHHLSVHAGNYLPSYTLQFESTPAWIYYFTHLLWWGAGPVLTLFGCASGTAAVVYLIHNRRKWQSDSRLGSLVIICTTFAAFYLMSAGQRSKFTRYALPLLPPLAVLSGWFVISAVQKANSILRALAISAAIIGGLTPGAFYSRIYRQPDTRLQAAIWVEQNIPPDSSICHEPDLGFAVPPIGLGGPAYNDTSSKNYHGTLLDWGLLYQASDFPHRNQKAPITEIPGTEPLGSQEQQQKQVQSWLETCDWIILSVRFADQFLPLPEDFEAISSLYAEMLAGRHADF